MQDETTPRATQETITVEPEEFPLAVLAETTGWGADIPLTIVVRGSDDYEFLYRCNDEMWAWEITEPRTVNGKDAMKKVTLIAQEADWIRLKDLLDAAFG